RDPRVSQSARSRDRGSDASPQSRRSGRRSDQASELRRVQGVDARAVAGADRDKKGVRGTGRQNPMTAPVSSAPTLPTYADVEDAARQIAGVANRTPVVTSRTVDARTGGQIFFKCENLQRAGAFKFRGAYNALSRLTDDERRRGVVTFSSGNHAQAIALAGKLLNVPRVIVMPSDAPEVKRIATAGYGGEIVLYDRDREDREAIGRALARDRGLTLVPPYDHPHIIAGQGTAARELIEEAGALDILFSPCGGGGLLSGTALAAGAMAPGCL